MKRVYLDKLKVVKDPARIVSLPHASLGRPLLVGTSLDAKIADYIRALRQAGGVVNRSILIAAATGIVCHENPGLLRAYGGHLDLGLKWAESFFN